IASRQQAAVVMAQHRQYRALVTIGQHGLGETRLDRSTGMGHVTLNITIVVDHEEIDTAGASTAIAAIQTQPVHTKGVHTKTHSALGKARVEGQYCALAPFDLILYAMLVVTVHISVAQEQIKTAVFNKTIGVRLAGSQYGGGGHQSQCDGAQFVFSHL